MKKLISLFTAFGIILSSAAVLPETAVSEYLVSSITAQAKEKSVTDYTYEITPLLSPFNEYFFVKTDNPDPNSFRFIDESIQNSTGFLSAIDFEDEIFADIKYDDPKTGRVNGGYIFRSGTTDGGEVVLQDTSGDDARDTGIKLKLPALKDQIDYLIDTYATGSGFFEKMDSVEDGFTSICLYSGSRIRGELKKADEYWSLLTANHADLSFYIFSPFLREDSQPLFASYVYPFIFDSLGFPSIMAQVSRRLDSSSTYEWDDYYHYQINVTYKGETRSYGGAGKGDGQLISSDKIKQYYTFGTNGTKITLENTRALLKEYSAMKMDNDVPRDGELNYEDICRKVGSGSWVRVNTNYAYINGKLEIVPSYAYLYNISRDDNISIIQNESDPGTKRYIWGDLRYGSDTWIDGRYINNWEQYIPGERFADHPKSDILLTNYKLPQIKHHYEREYNEAEGCYVLTDKVDEITTKERTVLFKYNDEKQCWVADHFAFDEDCCDDIYEILTLIDYGKLDQKYLDMITLTQSEVEALNVDRNTNTAPHTSYNYDGSTKPGEIHEEHSFGEWTVTKAATCTAEGSKTRKCSICSKAETVSIPKTAHRYTDKVIAPTYDTQGYTLHTCSICSDSYKDTYTAKLIKTESISAATVSGITNKTYTGSAIKPAPTVTLSGKTLKSGTDYTVTYKNNISVGTASVTITGKGDYTGTISRTFKINAASVTKATVSGLSNKSYTGKAITQTPTVKLGSKTLKKGTDYTISFKNNKAVGTATVTIKGKGNYTGSIKKTFKITKASVAKAKVTGVSKKYKYTGKAIKPAVKVTLGGVTLKKGTDYTVSYKSNKKVGTATITITGKGSYKGTVKKTFKIVSA